MEKIWLSIDEHWNGPYRNSIHGKRALDSKGVESYCYHCGGDFLYRDTGYISWPGEVEGKFAINSGTIYLMDDCPHCGKVNNPHARVHVEAYDAHTEEPIDYFVSAIVFFRKEAYHEYLEEYEKDGKLVFHVSFAV